MNRPLSPDAILRKLRAEFDWVFKRRQDELHYAGLLELMIMNRLQEAGLRPGSCGDQGAVGLCEICAHARHFGTCSASACTCCMGAL